MSSALIALGLVVFALLMVGLLLRAAKSAGATQATLTETEADLKTVSEMMEKATDAQKNRPRTRRDALNRL